MAPATRDHSVRSPTVSCCCFLLDTSWIFGRQYCPFLLFLCNTLGPSFNQNRERNKNENERKGRSKCILSFRCVRRTRIVPRSQTTRLARRAHANSGRKSPGNQLGAHSPETEMEVKQQAPDNAQLCFSWFVSMFFTVVFSY